MIDAGTDYATLGMALDELQSATTVSELHGGLCGTLSAGNPKATSDWLENCIEESESTETAAENARKVFRDLELETWRVLASSDLEFMPLLPDDDAPLDERVGEVAAWCHAYLTGLALGGLEDFDVGEVGEREVSSVEEIVNDLSAISRAGLTSAEREDPDDADFAFAEIVEYIRAAVQIVFEEIGTARVEQSGIPASMAEH
mgnify:FL=1